jgi:glycosyltransferase involved in cell wall biosynthesis
MSPRFLYVLDSCGAGGIETTFLNVLRVWREEQPWASHHVLAPAGGALAPAFREAADSLTIATAPDEVERAWLAHYDVVYFLFERTALRWLPLVAARSHAAVVYGKGYDLAGTFRASETLRFQADASLMWGADAATFTTSELAAAYDAPSNRSVVLGKAADISRLLALDPPDSGTPARVVCVANLHVLKRLGDLLAAVAQLRVEIPGICVRFVGADPTGQADALRRQAHTLGFENGCELVGPRSDVAGDLAASRVFALPSGCEGVPTAMLEAMAAARPVVMTNVGHVGTVVHEGVEGFLVSPGDVEALAGRLRILLTDRDRAMQMGMAARERAREHDVRIVASRLRRALERASSGAGLSEEAA